MIGDMAPSAAEQRVILGSPYRLAGAESDRLHAASALVTAPPAHAL
jgi:alpha-D-ribose 1-methylphosphonate 5-triphosphate diphosphatase PhnM